MLKIQFQVSKYNIKITSERAWAVKRYADIKYNRGIKYYKQFSIKIICIKHLRHL